MNPVFEWCKKCDLFKNCYDEVGPHYLEPDCGDGPYKKNDNDNEAYPF